MPLDTSIALGVRAPEIVDPSKYAQMAAEQQMNALRGQVLQQQMQQNALTMQNTMEDRRRAEAARQQSAAEKAALKAQRAQILKEANNDPVAAASLALKYGYTGLAEDFAKARESVAKAGSEEADLEKKAFTNAYTEMSAYAPLVANGAIPGRAVVDTIFKHPVLGKVFSSVMTPDEALAYADKDPQGLAKILATPPDKIYEAVVTGSQAKPTVLPPGATAVDLNPASPTYGQPIAKGEPVGVKGGLTEAQRLREKRATADDYNMATTALRDIQDVTRTVDKLASTDLGGVTGYASVVPSLTETSLKAESDIESLKGKMTALAKTLSAASGKLGNLAVAEYQMLRDQIAAFDPYRGEAATKQQLNDIKTTMDRIETSVRDVYSRTYGGEDNPFEQFRELPTEIGAKTKSGANNKSIFDAADAILGGK